MKKCILFIFISFSFNTVFCQYKTAENYIIVEIGHLGNPMDSPYSKDYNLITHNGLFVVSENNILSFIQNDCIDKSKLILILHEWLPFVPEKNNVLKKKCLIDFVTFAEFLLLGDTPIYKIGGKLYVIRKIKYAYFDGIDAYARKDDKFFQGDDIDTDYLDATPISAKKYYNVDYFQFYLFLMELIPNHQDLQRCFWKKRYELLNNCLF
jgi:hypothetical protein